MRWMVLLFLWGCGDAAVATAPTVQPAPVQQGQAEAVFAGECFWCMEAPFDKVDGVISTESGYTGGVEEGPTYHAVASGKTSHFEALRVVYDPTKVSYSQLLTVFWHNIDPTQDNGQFCDRGAQYLSAIFVGNDAERKLAKESLALVQKQLKESIVTPILQAGSFWLAEDYHQDFYKKNPGRYYSYRAGCGRDRRLKQLWGEPAGH